MDLVQLRYFLKIAEHRSFTRAADDCGVSQPALSQQMARLEEELGCPVFDRRGRGLALTEAGLLLRERAARIVLLADDAVREVRDDGQTGRLVVAAIPTVAPYWLPEILAAFRNGFPRARVEVHEEVTESLLRRCSAGEIDVGILALPVDARHLEVEPLFDEELLAVLPAGHVLAARNTVGLSDLGSERLLLLNEAHCLSGSIEALCQERSVQPLVAGRMSQLATIQELVSLGQGVSLIPDMAARLDTNPSRVYRGLEAPVPRRSIAACWNAYRYQSRLARSFLDMVRDRAGVVQRRAVEAAEAEVDAATARSSSRRRQS